MLLANLNGDSALRKKLQGAEEIGASVAMAKEARFDVSKVELLS